MVSFMREIVKCLILFLGISLVGFDQTFSQNEIDVHNAKPGLGSEPMTNLNVGPTESQYSINVGNILNAHFFPGLLDYSKGNYSSALRQMRYFIERPQYTRNHPQHLKFLSTAHYICGMIHLYHDFGYERYDRAKENFAKSIQQDPGNHLAYLGISRVFSEVELKDQAIYTLQKLLELKPKEDIAQQAKKELSLLQSKKSK
jgi:tetratricopeptide (TPR) repeat protein